MFTDNTFHAVALLCEASGYDASKFFGSYLNPGDRSRLSRLLISHGLLDRNGKLTRPLHTISLFELLVALEDGIYPVEPSKVESSIYQYNNKTTLRLGVLNQMISEFLSDIPVSDIQNAIERRHNPPR